MLQKVIPLSEPKEAALAHATRLVYLVFERRNLGAQQTFMEEFGLTTLSQQGRTLYMGAQAESFYCYRCEEGARDGLLGFGLAVSERAELERLAQRFGVASEFHAWPLPHEKIVLRDPNGLAIEVLWMAGDVDPSRDARPAASPRGRGEEIRLVSRPARIHKLGHLVLDVFRFQESVAWYRELFGMLPTDVLCLDSGEPVVAFMRFDRGSALTEHHSLVISSNIQVGCNHSAYEVSSLDDMAMGQQVLQARRRRHVWGIGRHLLGSQLFDYWRDPAGEVVEHYFDSDRYDASRPVEYHRLSSSGLYQWGPNVPAGFGLPKLDAQKLQHLFKAAFAGDLKLGRVLRMKKQMSEPAKAWL
ncbi:MAG: hypothetical protein QM778_35345 [Myxococcales bacterium]